MSSLSRLSRWCVVIALAHPLLSAERAGAVDFYWNVAGPADWNVGTNWVPVGPPFGGGLNNAFVNDGGTAEIAADIEDIQDIFVGIGVATSGTLNQTGGSTFQGTAGWILVGQDGGAGTYNLSGGTQSKDRLYIGRGANANGTFNLSGTGVVTNDQLLVGVDGGTGAANLSENGSVATTGNVEVHNGSLSVTGNATISSGDELWVGSGGGNVATSDVDSGVVEADSWISVGRDSSTGTFDLSGTGRLAKLGADQAFITLGGLGSGGGGTINIQDNAVLESATGLVLAETAGRYGIVNQTGGTVSLHDFANPTFGKSLHVDYAGDGLGEYHLSGGTLNAETIDATSGVFEMVGGVLSATTFEGNLDQAGGTTSPGSSPGTMTVAGDYSLLGGDLFIELNGTTVGTEHDQLIVTGDVSLSGDLTLAVGFSPSNGDSFTIIDNQGANPVSGTFSQGMSVTVAAIDYTIDYAGGDGNDVVLAVVGGGAVLEIPVLSRLGLLGLCLCLVVAAVWKLR